MVYYLDVICILSQDAQELKRVAHKVIKHLESLGFILNRRKSLLTPFQVKDYLGFEFDTKSMKIKVPEKKIKKLIQRMKQASSPQTRSCRWVASLLGKITAMLPAVGEALLHIRHLQRCLAKNLYVQMNNWEAPCKLSTQATEELQWWKLFMTKKNGLPIRRIQLKKPQVTITTDSSDTGWGINSTVIQTYGFWTEEEKLLSINVRELMAIYFALKLHGPKFKNGTIKILTDNKTSIKYTTKEGGTASVHLQDYAAKVQDLCNLYHLDVIYQHIKGIDNVEAGKLSRTKKPIYESAIPRSFFQQIQEKWDTLKIDIFLSRCKLDQHAKGILFLASCISSRTVFDFYDSQLS